MIGLLQTGYIADRIRVPNAFIISGVMIVALGIVSFFVPAIKQLTNKRLPKDV